MKESLEKIHAIARMIRLLLSQILLVHFGTITKFKYKHSNDYGSKVMNAVMAVSACCMCAKDAIAEKGNGGKRTRTKKK